MHAANTTLSNRCCFSQTALLQPKRRLRSALLVSVSMLALAQAPLATPVLAQAGGCTTDTATTPGTTIFTCSGAISKSGPFQIGVDARPATGSVSVISSSTISATGQGSLGLAGESYDANVSITSNGSVSAMAYGIAGFAYGPGGSVSITSNAPVSTTSSNDPGQGVIGAAIAGGNVTITSNAAISTTGEYTNGILGAGQGTGNADSVAITSNAGISTIGVGAAGIFGINSGGSVSITSHGAISTTGQWSYGIFASGKTAVAVNAGGSISTTGSEAHGIHVNDAAAITVNVNRAISTTGTSANGISSTSRGPTTIDIGSTGSVYVADPTAFAITSAAGTGSPHTLNNTGTVTGNITMTGGTVALNNLAGGTINSGMQIDLVVGGGLVLVGPGSPAGTGLLTNAGRLSPGGHGAIQTTALSGNYVQTSTGVLKVDADWTGNGGAGAADRLVVTGTAVLAGTVVVNPINFPTTVGLTRSFHVLTAFGGITNNGISIANTAAVNYALLFGELTDLFVRATINFQPVTTTGLTDNQSAVGGALNTIFGGGTALPFMTALMTLPAGNAYGQALNQLAPMGDAASNSAAMATANTFAGHLLSCRSAGEEGEVNRFIKEGQCVWARVSARRLGSDARVDAGGYQETATFYTAGAQVKVAQDWRIGGGLGYENSNLSTDASASSASERLHLGGVVKYTPGPLMLAASVTGGFGWHDNIRHVAFGGFGATATSSNQSSFIGGRLTAAYLLSRGVFYLKPQVELAATRLMREGYSEHASGGIALRVLSADATVLSVAPSVELGVESRSGNGFTTRAFVKAGVTVRDTSPFITNASFIDASASGGPFAISSRIDKTTADIGSGIDLISANDTTLRLQYDGQFGDHITLHSGGAKLSVKF